MVKLPRILTFILSRRRREGPPVFEVGLPARGPLGHHVLLLLESDPRGHKSVVVFHVRFRGERPPGGEVEVKDAGQRESVDGEEGAGQHGSRVSGDRRVEGGPPYTECASRSAIRPPPYFFLSKARLANQRSRQW